MLAAALVGSASGAAWSDPQRFELPYRDSEGGARRVIVQVTLNGRTRVPMALDTGAPGMVISLELARRLDVFSGDQGNLLVAARGIGGVAPSVRTLLDSVNVGGATHRLIPVSITEKLSDAFEGLLGMDVLSNYSMTIDSGRKVVVLQEQRRAGDAPGGHDESWWRSTFAELRAHRDAWQRFRDQAERESSESQISAGTERDRLDARRALARFQLQEAEKLVARLERYASLEAVPRHWR
jgi:hypothetical protein